MTFRAMIWRKAAAAPLLGLGDFVLWCLAALAIQVLVGYLGAGDRPYFDIYGLSALVAWRAIVVLLGVFLIPVPFRATVLSAALVLSILANALAAIAPLALSLLPAVDLAKVWGFEARHSAIALDLMYLVWMFGAVLALFRSVSQPGRWRNLARTAAYIVLTFAATQLFPHLPVFAPANYDPATANMWEARRAAAISQAQAQRPQIDSAQVTLAQPALLDAAAARLLPQRPGIADIYTLSIAGSSSEDVFIRELNGGLASLARVLPIEGRAVRLINHPSTLNAAPLASLQNFAAAVHAIGAVMNKEEDILLLFMTSHGSGDGFALAMEGVGRSILRPDQVASILDSEGIRNRIVIISACYSGVFVKPLAGDTSIVLTAADENSASFGCSNERDWTFFGDALFNQSLQRGVTLEQAFEKARQLIGAWEADEKLAPSNPQASFGAALAAKLQALYLRNEAPAWPWPPVPAARSDNDGIWGKRP